MSGEHATQPTITELLERCRHAHAAVAAVVADRDGRNSDLDSTLRDGLADLCRQYDDMLTAVQHSPEVYGYTTSRLLYDTLDELHHQTPVYVPLAA